MAIIGGILLSALISLLIYFLFPLVMRGRYGLATIFYIVFNLYYILGLLPISTRRDYFDVADVIVMLLLANFGLLFGWFVRSSGALFIHRDYSFDLKFYLAFSKVLIGVAALSSVLIIAQWGLLVKDPSLRFNVSSYYIYIVELSLLGGVMYGAVKAKSGAGADLSTILVYFFVVVLLLTTGYRNQAVLFMVAVGILFFCNYYYDRELPSVVVSKMVSLSIFFVLTIITIGYYFRVEMSGVGIFDWESRVIEFDVFAPNYVLPLLAIHDAARENIAVTYGADYRLSMITSFVPQHFFMWVDFGTLIPGNTLTATGILGLVVNRSESDFLTPGLVGALYLTYGYFGVAVGMAVLSYVFRRLFDRYIVNKNVLSITTFVIFSVYFLQLLYRGIPKPMYLLLFLVIIFANWSRSLLRRA